MARELADISFVLRPDDTKLSFGSLFAQARIGTSDDPDLTKYCEVPLKLTDEEVKMSTVLFNNQIENVKKMLSIP